MITQDNLHTTTEELLFWLVEELKTTNQHLKRISDCINKLSENKRN